MIGCAIARALAGGGAGRVVVFERAAHAGSEASGAAAGVLVVASSRAPRGVLFALKRASAALFPALADELRTETGIDVEYATGGVLDLAFSSREAEQLDRFVVRQRERGFTVHTLDGDTVRSRYPEINPAVRGAALFADDASLNAARFVEALHASAAKRGVTFRLGAPVRRIVARGGRVLEIAVGEAVRAAARRDRGGRVGGRRRRPAACADSRVQRSR